jgi:hypothetical protein
MIKNSIRIITLDTKWTNCGICNIDMPMLDGGYYLPMYEGKIVNPDKHEWAGFSVCDECYEKYNHLTEI